MKGYCNEVKQFSDACHDGRNPTRPVLMTPESISFITISITLLKTDKRNLHYLTHVLRNGREASRQADIL